MADQEPYIYTIALQVRNYECDMEGIVNNAVYLNYLEHARHQFLRSAGIDFAELTQQGIHPVVIRSEVDYKIPLRSGDRFWVGVNVERVSKLRIAFVQDIFRSSDVGDADKHHVGLDDLAVRARIITAVISSSGRPMVPEKMHPRMAELIRVPS